uniref:Uncharacterized protein n=1 Tax=Rhizophagus irregularis (strain DAOM 181602 / DAOM 197198 / MUCL 43194) TaxID=747089 RepID=U9TK20_RHIID
MWRFNGIILKTDPLKRLDISTLEKIQEMKILRFLKNIQLRSVFKSGCGCGCRIDVNEEGSLFRSKIA